MNKNNKKSSPSFNKNSEISSRHFNNENKNNKNSSPGFNKNNNNESNISSLHFNNENTNKNSSCQYSNKSNISVSNTNSASSILKNSSTSLTINLRWSVEVLCAFLLHSSVSSVAPLIRVTPSKSSIHILIVLSVLSGLL